MPHVMNCLNKQVSTQVLGKWFTFKPNEIKMFYQPEIANFMGQKRGDEGLVEIPDFIMEKDKNDPERVQFLDDRRKEGIHKRVQKLEWQKHNLLASMRLDLEVKGLKIDPLILASNGDVEALRELKTLSNEILSNQLSNADKIKELLNDGDTGSTNSGTINPGRSNVTEPTKAGKQSV